MNTLIQAKNFTPANRFTGIDLIVIHSMEFPEKPRAARQVAEWFADKGAPKYPAPKASAHYCIDNLEVIQCVLEKDIAWHAPGANHNGIGLEHAGYARQTEAEWKDDYSVAMLMLSAKLAAEISIRYAIQPVWLSPDDLKAKKRGFTSHANVTLAFQKSGHMDPGPNFPVQWYLDMVKSYQRTLCK